VIRAKILGTGAAVPKRILSNADLERLVETSDEWITTRTGIKERHIVADGDHFSDLCTRAGEMLLAQHRPELGLAAVDKALLTDPTNVPAQRLRRKILDAMSR